MHAYHVRMLHVNHAYRRCLTLCLTNINNHGLDVRNFIKKLGFPEEIEDELVKIFEGEYARDH